MSRDDGFAVADVATAKHTDPKFRRLWRHLTDEAAMNAAVALYEAVQLTSWQQGERVPVDEAAPFWMTDVTAASAALQHVGLLDKDGLIPAHAWASWYGPAYERREQRREAGRIGGKSGRGDGGSGAQPTPKQPSSAAASHGEARLNPSVPTVPSVPSVPPAPSSPGHAPAQLERADDGLAPVTEEELASLRQAILEAPTAALRKRYTALLERKEAARVH